LPEADVPPKDPQALDSLLSARARQAVEQALRSGGDIPQADIEQLNRLARLAELQRTAVQQPRRPLLVVVLAVATLVIVSVLLFARVRQTEIELDVNATEFGFSFGHRQILLENAALALIGASGLTGVQLPAPVDTLLAGPESSGEASAIRIATSGADTNGSINVGAIVLDAGTEVWLRQGEKPSQYRLSLRDPRDPIQIDVFGNVEISLAGVPPRPHTFEAPRGIVLRPGSDIVSLDMVFLDPKHPGVTPQVAVNGLNFSRVEEIPDRSLSLLRRLSTLVSGTLYLESLNSQRRELRAGEDLQFSRAEGTIRLIRLEPEHLSLNFHGWVRGMHTGSENLMPTWLEWLRARHGLSLFWGTAMYLFGLGLAAARWVKGAL